MKRAWPWIIAALGIVLFVGANGQVRRFCAEALTPFGRVVELLKGQLGGRFGAAWRGFCDGPMREALGAEVERLRVMLAESERLAAENQALREALGWRERSVWQVVAAPVWSHGGGLGVWPRLTLGVGSAQGVQAGDAVVAPEGVVGRVAEGVTRHRCEVILLSDPLCRVAAEVPGEAKGVVQGCQGEDFGQTREEEMLYVAQALRMRFVGKQATVRAQQEVFTEGSGGLFPAGLRIGRVLAIQPEESGLLQELTIEPAVNPALLRTVFVLVGTHALQRPEERGGDAQ